MMNADQHAALAAREALDRGVAQARGEDAVGGARRAAAHHVAEARDAQLEADRIALLLVVVHELRTPQRAPSAITTSAWVLPRWWAARSRSATCAGVISCSGSAMTSAPPAMPAMSAI